MQLPQSVDLTPKGKLVFERPEYGEIDYFENVEYTLQISVAPNGIEIDYYGEDGNYLEDE
jgi:hypothetical protein